MYPKNIIGMFSSVPIGPEKLIEDTYDAPVPKLLFERYCSTYSKAFPEDKALPAEDPPNRLKLKMIIPTAKTKINISKTRDFFLLLLKDQRIVMNKRKGSMATNPLCHKDNPLIERMRNNSHINFFVNFNFIEKKTTSEKKNLPRLAQRYRGKHQ